MARTFSDSRERTSPPLAESGGLRRLEEAGFLPAGEEKGLELAIPLGYSEPRSYARLLGLRDSRSWWADGGYKCTGILQACQR